MITISQQVISDILEYMKQVLPYEGCGYLGGEGTTITHFQAMSNVLNSPTEFAFDPREQFKTVRNFRNMGISIVGVVHSHPNGKVALSDKDIEHADPNLFQIIVEPQTEKIKAFSVKGNLVLTHDIVVI